MRGKHTVLWIVVGVMLGIVSASLAEDKKEHETLATILARQIQTVLNASSVLGKPLDFNGTKIIPIVRMGFKFGAAIKQNAANGDDEDEDEEESGTGWSVGSFIVPQGLLIITKDGEVKVIGLRKEVLSEQAMRAKQPGVEKPEEPKGPPAKP
jgi:uncharacterized spore protein YtfJ